MYKSFKNTTEGPQLLRAQTENSSKHNPIATANTLEHQASEDDTNGEVVDR